MERVLKNDSQPTGTAIGIDLGFTNAYIAVYQDDLVEVLPNYHGDLATPAYVSFTDSGCLIGAPAQDQSAITPTNTVFNVKQLIGRPYSDLVDIHAGLPFKIVEKSDNNNNKNNNNNNNKPRIQVDFKHETMEYSPEEISAIILTKLKETSSSYLEADITEVVVTVPSYFNDAQRQATKNAGKMAGLTILRVINEPSAACIAYKLDKLTGEERNILVFHLGGHTLAITHFNLEDGIFELVNTTHDHHLGGQDFTDRLVDHCVKELKNRFSKDLTLDPQSLYRLRIACEKAKCELSSLSEAQIEIESLFEAIDYQTTVTQTLFDELTEDLVARIQEHFDEFLHDSKIDKDLVHGIVLSGGSTRLPKIQSMIADYFDRDQEIYSSIKPEEVVARGAALMSHVLTIGNPIESLCCMFDVTSLSLGIETAGGVMTTVVRRLSTIPTRKSEIFSTAADNQTSVLIQVYEGQRARAADNHWLGQIEISGISPAPRGVPQIEVKFELDTHGELMITATDRQRRRNHPRQIKIRNDVAGEGRRHSVAEIEAMIVDAEKHAEEDEVFRLQVTNQVEGYVVEDGSGSPCRDVILLPPPSDDGFFEPEIQEVD